MLAELGLGEITNVQKCYKRREIVKSHVRQSSEETRHTE